MSLQPIAELTGLSISAPDGVIGSLDDLLFDDTSWRVRYLVIRSGSWLDERMVLIAPRAFVSADLAARTLHVSLSREQIQQSPGIETDPPVYRQHEVNADAMIPPWAIYGGMYAPVIFPYAKIGSRATEKNAADAPSHDSHDPHLRSAREVIGYRIADNEGETGQIVDFILDDEAWTMRYAVVQTGHWFAKKRALLALSQVDEISWERRVLATTVSRERIAASPEYTEAMLLEPAFESHLLQYYLGNTPLSLADLRGLPVFEIEHGTFLGVIDDLYLDLEATRCVALLVRSGGMFRQRAIAIPFAAIQLPGDDVWLARDQSAPVSIADYEAEQGHIRAQYMIGRPIVTEGGTPLGALGQPIIRRDGSLEGFGLQAVQVAGPLNERRFIARSALTSMGDQEHPATTTLAAAERSWLL